MKVGERGQITIPKELRDRFGLHPASEVELLEKGGELLIRRKAAETPLRLRSWTGCLQEQPADVDEFIEDIRGR